MSAADPHTPPAEGAAGDDGFGPVSRRAATIINLIYQYASMALVIIRGVVLPPLFWAFLGENLLGAWLAATNVLNWIMISEGGAWLLLRQQTAQEFGRADRAALNAVIGTGLLLLFALFIVIAAAGIALAPFAPGWFGITGVAAAPFSWSFAFTALALALSLIACGPRAVQQGFQRQIGVNMAALSSEIVSLAATLVLLYRGYGVLAIGLGTLIREVLHNLINWPLFLVSLRRMGLRPVVSRSHFAVTFPLMGWTFVSNVGISLRTNVDAFVVAIVLGNPVVVMTEYSKKIWDIITMVLSRASNAFTPALAHLHGSGDLPRFREIGARLMIVVAVALAVMAGGAWALNRSFYALWITETNYAGESYNALCGAATVLTVFVLVFNDVLFASGNIRGTAAVQIAQTVVRTLLLIATLGWLGPLAVPLTVIAGVLLGGLHYLLGEWRKLSGITRMQLAMQLRPALIGTLVAAAAAVVWQILPSPESWLALSAHAAALSVVILLALYRIEPDVRGLLNGALAAVASRVQGRRSAPHADRGANS